MYFTCVVFSSSRGLMETAFLIQDFPHAFTFQIQRTSAADVENREAELDGRSREIWPLSINPVDLSLREGGDGIRLPTFALKIRRRKREAPGFSLPFPRVKNRC